MWKLLWMRFQSKKLGEGREGKKQPWHFGMATGLKLDLQQNANSITSRCIIRKDTISNLCFLYLKSGETYLPYEVMRRAAGNCRDTWSACHIVGINGKGEFPLKYRSIAPC